MGEAAMKTRIRVLTEREIYEKTGVQPHNMMQIQRDLSGKILDIELLDNGDAPLGTVTGTTQGLFLEPHEYEIVKVDDWRIM